MSKKIIIPILSIIILFLILPSVSSQANKEPFASSELGLQLETPPIDAIQTGQSHRFHIHVINTTNIVTNRTATCFIHVYNKSGWDSYGAMMEFEAYNGIDFVKTVDGGNFSIAGEYPLVFTCNTSKQAGFLAVSYEVNDYGKIITEGEALNFNYSMIFLMVLFVISLIGIFTFQNPAGKLASYWVCHVLFIVGSFSVWQFNQGFAVGGGALSGVFQVLFYVSIIAMFPMVLLSVVWAWWLTLMSDDIKKMMDRGMEEDEAYSRARRKKRW